MFAWASIVAKSKSILNSRYSTAVVDALNNKSDIQNVIKKHNVLIFSKTTCGFCLRLKHTFNQAEIPYSTVEVNQLQNGPEIQSILHDMTGIATVPNVFIGGEHIGDSSQTIAKLQDGSLTAQLKKLGINPKI